VQNTCTQTGGAGGTIPADLVFSTDSAGSSKLPWEVQFYDGAAGTLIAWVQVPTVSNSSDIVFYMAYGDAGVTTQQNTGSYAPANVWDTNYKGVWHLNDTASSATIHDSTTNTNNGTATSGMVGATGKIGVGAKYPVSNTADDISIPNSASLTINGPFSMSIWFNLPSGANSIHCLLAKDYYAGYTGSIGYNPYYQDVNCSDTVTNTIDTYSHVTVPYNTWVHAVLTINSSNANIYINGSYAWGVTPGASPNYFKGAYPLLIGGKSTASFQTTPIINGMTDEARISNVVRSADWVKTEYNNQNAPGNIGTPGFLTYGVETANGGSSFQPAWAQGSNRILVGGIYV
jgi:hypothetical protein